MNESSKYRTTGAEVYDEDNMAFLLVKINQTIDFVRSQVIVLEIEISKTLICRTSKYEVLFVLLR